MSVTGALAAAVFFCFAVASQAQPASSAKQFSQELEVFSLDPVKALKQPQRVASCCFCGAVVPFTLEHRPYFSNVSSADEIREINLDDLKKIIQRDPKDTRPLLINFWATWCDPCREEFPDLVKVDSDYRAKGLNFVAVSLDDVSDIRSLVPKFLKEMKAEMPVVLLNVNDPEPAIKAVDATWDGQLPATFLYDKEGKIVFKHFGKIDPVELRAAIDKAVDSKKQ